jgi:hypothetical protein
MKNWFPISKDYSKLPKLNIEVTVVNKPSVEAIKHFGRALNDIAERHIDRRDVA